MNSVGNSATAPAALATPLFLGSLGFVAGVCSGFLGIGGGLVIVPALTLLVGYPIKRAVGASLGTIVLVSLIGVLVEFAIKGPNIQWSLAIVVTVGSLVGARLASRILPAASPCSRQSNLLPLRGSILTRPNSSRGARRPRARNVLTGK